MPVPLLPQSLLPLVFANLDSVINLPIPPLLPLINGSVLPVELELNHALSMLIPQLHALMLLTKLLDKTALLLPQLVSLPDLKVSGMILL